MKLTQNLLDYTWGKNRLRITLLIIFFANCFLFAQIAAQTVTGKIVDSNGEPLSGANILEKGTTNGTMADFDGNYSINVSGESPVLVFTYLGYVSKEIQVAGKTLINVTLEEDANVLSEVTVVGYGTQKKSDITGAVSSVKAKDIEGFALARVDQALQGKTSGVYILNADSAPGGSTIIRIRGTNSINGGNQPLIVIDGLQGGSLDNLNPNDIESVEILKDASATAIYGSRGANGVVLVTTRQGKLGKPKIEVSNSISFQNVIKKLPIMSAGEFARVQNLIRSIDTWDGNVPVPVFTDAQVAAFDAGPSTNAQDAVYGTGKINNTQLSIGGGTEKLRYFISGNYLDQDGILINSAFNRANLRTNITADISSFLKVGLNYNFVRYNATSPSFRNGEGVEFDDQVVNTAVRWSPTEPLFDENGVYYRHSSEYGAKDAWNPIASAREPINDNRSYNNVGNLFLDFKILDGLNLRINGGGSINMAYNKRFLNSKTKTGLASRGRANVADYRSEYFQNSNVLTYDKEFGKHKLKLTGLLEQAWSKSDGIRIQASRFVAEELGFNNLAGAEQSTTVSEASQRNLLSYMGRLNYAFNDKYLLTATYRADASSVFGDNNKWGYFPSLSVAWKASEESFVKNMVDHMDLKFRYSWGKTGNQGIAPYQSLARLLASGGTSYPDGSGGVGVGFGFDRLQNPNLKWETTTQGNFGIDLGLFNNRLTTTFDVYTKTTDDLLLRRQVPAITGVSRILDNIGSVENKGFELIIGGDPIRKNDFRWSTSFNISANKNKVLDLGEDKEIFFQTTGGGYGLSDFMVLEVGKPFGTMRGYVYEGVWSTAEDAEARSYGQLPGMAKYKDVNGDGKVDDEDKTDIGFAYPDFTWGWTNDLKYKQWNLSFSFVGSEGADLFNQARIRREASDERTSPRALNYWTPDNQNTDVPGFIDGAYIQSQGLTNQYSINGTETSRWVEDASFIRLKTLQLSYSFDKNKMTFMDKAGIDNISLFFSGTNLFTITDYTGYDPEVAAFPNLDHTLGVDFSVYPAQKTYTFGLKLNF